MLLKVMPLGCRATSGSLVTCTFPFGKCGSDTAHTQLSSPTPTVTSNTTPHRPTVTLDQVLSNGHSSARHTTSDCSPDQAPTINILSSSSCTSGCDLVSSISYLDLFHCLHLDSSKFSSDQRCTTQTVSRSTQSRLVSVHSTLMTRSPFLTVTQL